MIELNIVADVKKGCKGRCDAVDSTIEEVAMMIALLEKYKYNIQNNFNKLADFTYDTGMIDLKKKGEDKKNG